MKATRIDRFSLVFITVPALYFLFLMTTPLWAEVPVPNQPSTKDEKIKEVLPSEPHVYMEDQKRVLDRLIFVSSLDASYSLSHQSGTGSNESGGNISGLLSPRYMFSNSLSFTLMYHGNYYKELDFFSDLVGPRATTETQRHSITPMFRIDFGEDSRYFFLPSFFHTRTYNKDVEGGGWNDGLYNYRDYGGGLDFGVKDLRFGTTGTGRLRMGVQYYKRHYPNYDSLLDLVTGIATEKDERDYNGLLTKIAYNWRGESGFSWGTNYYLLYKRLDDKKVVDVPSGELSSKEQRDYFHNLRLRLGYDIQDVDGRLYMGIDINGSIYDSNQNYYDGMGTFPDLSDDTPIADYYDFYLYGVRPNILYTFAIYPITTGLSYSYEKTDYRDRRAQFSDGSYKRDKQYETRHVIRFNVSYRLFENLSVYGQYQYLDVNSNNDNFSTYEYDHSVHYFYLGVSIRF